MKAVESLLLTDLGEIAGESAKKPFDAVVIGGGPTGVTAARTLGEHGHRVALLEAGPLAVLTHASSTDLRFNGGSVRALQEALSYSPRSADGSHFGALVACLGGRGVFWNGAAPRYLPEDFRAWPLSYTDIDPTYAWAERELFVSRRWGSTHLADLVARLLRLAGIDAEPEPFAIDAATSVDGWLSGTIGNPVALLLRSGMLADSSNPGRLRVATAAFALRVDRPKGSRLLEIAARDQVNGTSHTIAARAAVLAAGGFESVRIAITSEMPDESGLLGRRLTDHWFARGYFPLPPEIYDSQQPEAGAALIRPTSGQPFQMEVHMPARRFFHARADSGWSPARTEEYSAMVRAFAPTRSQDTSRLEVTAADQPGGYTVHMDVTPADRELTSEMQAGLARVRDALNGDEAAIETYPLGSSYHEAGGLQMGADARSGVVNPFGRFWGESRVWSMDASAWPTVSCANPHLTLVAVARRQATRLAGELATDR